MIESAASLRNAVEALLAELAYLLDHGQADQAVALFTEDAAFVSPLATLRGRAELTAGFAARAAQTHVTRHLHSNLRIAAEGADRARATVVLTVYRAEGPGPGLPRPFLVADCLDVYERGGDGCWRFAERTIVPIFVARREAPAPAASGASA
ncbi:MAG: nuclear transport factor 2 family protein [Thermodesulfobacteriota bacterium]